MIEGLIQMTEEEKKEMIQKAFKRWELNACRSIQHDTDEDEMLITLLNKYHADDEKEDERTHQ